MSANRNFMILLGLGLVALSCNSCTPLPGRSGGSLDRQPPPVVAPGPAVFKTETKQESKALPAKPAAPAPAAAPVAMPAPAVEPIVKKNIQIIPSGVEAGEADDANLAMAAEQTGAQIEQYIEEGSYAAAINAYQELLNLPGAQIPLPIKKNYGLALLRAGQLDAASRVFDEVIAEADQSAESWSAQRPAADLLVLAGRFNEAKAIYQRLLSSSRSPAQDISWAQSQLQLLDLLANSDEGLNAYLGLLKLYLVSDPRLHSRLLAEEAEKLYLAYPGTPVGLAANRIMLAVEETLRAWAADKLVEVDALVVNQEYQKALAILEKLQASDLPAELNRTVLEVHEQVSGEEAIELEAQLMQIEQTMARQLETAGNLLDSRRYDEAIVAFTLLLGTEYDEMAAARIQEAEGLAAKEKRKEAADLFVKASRSSDPEKKKGFLLASRRLLKEIMLKYPRVDIIDKVASNLEIIEEQLREYDPAMLEENEAGQQENTEAPSLVNDGGLSQSLD